MQKANPQYNLGALMGYAIKGRPKEELANLKIQATNGDHKRIHQNISEKIALKL